MQLSEGPGCANNGHSSLAVRLGSPQSLGSEDGQRGAGQAAARETPGHKTFIGRIERGFDFLGYHFGTDGFTVAAKTIEHFVARAIRLYEQEPGEADASARLGSCVPIQTKKPSSCSSRDKGEGEIFEHVRARPAGKVNPVIVGKHPSADAFNALVVEQKSFHHYTYRIASDQA